MAVNNPDFGKEPSDNFGILSLVQGFGVSEQQWPTSRPETYGAFYRDLAKALATGSSGPVTAKEGRNVIRLIELALESAKSGRTLDVLDM
jgi:predicted dehydrogenase